MNYQDRCNCNELCYFYIKVSKSSSGDELVKTAINKCQKNSKKNICDYFNETFISSEKIKLIDDIKYISHISKPKSELDKIKEEILNSIDNFNLREKVGISNYMIFEKITALCFRIKIKPFNYKNETIESFKNRLTKHTTLNSNNRNMDIINLIPKEDFPFLVLKTNNNKLNSKNSKRYTRVNRTSCLIFTNTNSLIKCSIEDDDEDEELDENPFDMESYDSDNELEDCSELNTYNEKDFEY